VIKAAVGGIGDVSSVHLDAIAAIDDAELVAVCDTDPSATDGFAVPSFRLVPEMLDTVRPDVVHVCTPHDQHFPVAFEVLQRGIPMLLEKPIASTITDGSTIVDMAKLGNSTVGVCFQNRYNPTSIALQQALASGRYGAVLGARAQVMWTRTADYYREKPWRGSWTGGGGGILMNQAIHTIDLVQWLLGDVTDVSGEIATLLFADTIEVEDTAVGVFHHASGIRTNFYATLTHFENAPVFIEVRCEYATLRLEGDLVVIHNDGRRELLAEQDSIGTARSYWGASHERLIRDFYAHLQDQRHFWIDSNEAMKSLHIAKAFYSKEAQ